MKLGWERTGDEAVELSVDVPEGTSALLQLNGYVLEGESVGQKELVPGFHSFKCICIK